MTAIRRSPAIPRNTGPLPPRPQTLKGKVSLKTVGGVSKSRHTSLVMTVKGKTVQLQRLGGNPFEIDAKEKALVGKSVELKGFFVNDHIFRFSAATVSAPKQ
jgi:hypothetical protein